MTLEKDSIAYEDKRNMPYISNIERESEARGREAGKVEGEDLMDFTSSKDLADWLQHFASS
jgi:hypothetical protein